MATHNESLAETLPFANRPIEEAPDHWVLACAGKTVLCPGGLAPGTWALKRTVLPGSDVVKFAPGLDVTASAIIEVGPASYVSVERDPNASAHVNAIASDVGRCVNADAAETGLPDRSTDVVIGKAILSMRGGKARRVIMNEAARILRPGGRCVTRELGMCPDSIAEEPATEIHHALAHAVNINARPLTITDWKRALEEVGFVVKETRIAPMALLKPDRVIADEGVLGALHVIHNVAWDKDLHERVTMTACTFKEYDRHLCDATIVTHKPKKNQ